MLAIGIQERWFPDAPWMFLVLTVPCLIAGSVAAMPASRWPCPRCGETFFRRWWHNHAFARRCMHCDLPKWAPADPEVDVRRASSKPPAHA